MATLPVQAAKQSVIAAGPTGLQLTTLEDMYRFAKAVATSGMAPKGMDKPETVLVAMQSGMELGFSPMAALQNITVINGRPSVYGDAGMGLIRASGKLEGYMEVVKGTIEKGDREWTIILKRIGESPISRTFSVADAKRAGLWAKQGPWSQFPDRMLKYRALAFCMRDGFSDILKGLKVAEEIDLIPEKNITEQVEVTDRRALDLLEPEPTPEPPSEVVTPTVEPSKPPEPPVTPAPPTTSRAEMLEEISKLTKDWKTPKLETACAGAGIKLSEGEAIEESSPKQLTELLIVIKTAVKADAKKSKKEVQGELI